MSPSELLSAERVDQILGLLLVLETEQRCLLSEWPEVLDLLRVRWRVFWRASAQERIQVATETERVVDMNTFEAIADILVSVHPYI